MKLYFAVLIVFCFSCQSKRSTLDTIKINVENYFKPTLPNADSYEFVDIANLDTITQKEFIERVIGMLNMNLMNVNSRLKTLDHAESEVNKTLSSKPNDADALLNKRDIQLSRSQILRQQQELDSLNAIVASADDKAIKFIQLNFTFRADNPKGEKIQHRYYIKLNGDLTVQSVSEVKK